LTFILVVTVRKYLNLYSRDFTTVSFDFGDNSWLVENIFTEAFTTESVNFSNLRHDFLKTGVDFFELLHALLLIHLLFDHHIVFFLSSAFLIIELSLLVTHALFKGFTLCFMITCTSSDSLIH